MLRRVIAALMCCAVTGALLAGPAEARQRVDDPPRAPSADVPLDQRDAGWRTSSDLAWATTGNTAGFHVLAAREQDGYAWRTVATLAEPGLETDMWVGNACLTGSGRRLVVAYAPRAFTNRQVMADRGAFAAIVNLSTGAVTKLDIRVSLAYFNPGCGAGEIAVLT
ncbi:hypothetical protein AB0K48_41705, partial [Nonomuraea sp. NPDC055795]